MATCPNKSSREWKTLVNAQGEDSAYYLWDKYNGEVPESFNTSLDERLINGFLKDFSITATEYNDLKEDLGIDSYSASDLVSKAIAYKKGQTITPEVAYFAYSMLGRKNNKIKSSLKYLINKWSKYQEKFDYYTEVIKEKEGFISDKREWQQKVRELVIIDFLKENIEDYYKNPVEFEKSLDTRWVRGIDKFKSDDFTLWESIIKFFEEALSIFSNKHKQKTEQLSNLGLAIADEILNKNYEYFNYDLAEGQIQKFYKQTIESDPFAKSLVEFGQKTLGMVLTGSLALRRAGQVFRTVNETLHDIDWVVPYSLSGTPENKEVLDSIYNIQNKYKKEVLELNPGSPSYQNNLTELEEKLTKECLNEIKNFDWYKKFQEKYPSFELLGGFYGGEHGDLESFTVQGVIDPERYDSLGSHKETWTAYSKDPKTKAPIAEKREILVPHLKGDIIKDTGYVIDFFVRLQENQEEHENYFKLWKEIMIAKLKMGRDKDFIDWKAFVPYVKSQDSFNFNYEGFRHFNYASSERNALEEEETKASFQLEGMPMSEASEETLTVVRELLKKMGVKIESLLEYAKTSKLDLKNVNALADTIKGIIAVAEGKEGVALTEEMVHIATAILEAKYPKMITEMISKIDRFKIYNITLKAYEDNPEYQLPNGKPNIRKIKKEAVDKLIAELIVNGGSDVAQYPELLEEENINFVQRIWNKVLDWFRGQYKESNIDIFKETTQKIFEGNLGARYYNEVKPGVKELFDSNPELANAVYEALGFKQTLTQDNKSYYRGQYEKPEIDDEGNLYLTSREDSLYAKAGLESYGVSMTENLENADEYGSAKNEIESNTLEEQSGYDINTWEYDAKQAEIYENGYWVIQIDKDVSNKVIREAGEVKLLGKVKIPKGKWRIENRNSNGDVEVKNQITPQQKQQALQQYSAYLDTIFPDSQVSGKQDIEGFKSFMQTAPAEFKGEGIYFQVLSAPQEVIQKELLGRQAKIKKVDSGEKVDPMFMDTEEASNWYEMQNAEGVWGKIEKRVTDRVKAWYRQRFGNKTFTKQEQAFNEFKRKFGVKAHGWFEDIHQRYFNSDGTRKTSIDKRKITLSQTEEDMYSQLEKYFTDLVAKFSENGKTPLVFSEIMLYDPKEKEAGTLDLVIVDETGKANIFDWKFMSVSQDAEDIAWYKQGAYNIQLGRYKEMLRDSYGIKEFGMNRAIPIIMDIKTPSSMNLNADPVVTGIAIGSVNPSEIKELKLIPVSEETESTGFDTLDTLIKDLNIVYRQISKTNVSDEEEKQFKSKRLNSIKKAIRAAQGSLNIAPLVEVIREMRISGQMIIDDYTNTYANRPAASDDIDNRELSDFSDEMREYLAFAEVFGRVDDRIKNLIYTSEMDAEAKTEEEKEAVNLRKDLLDSIREETSKIREHQDNVKKISGKFADKFIGQRNLVTGLLNAEAVLKGLGALFNGVSDLPLASLKILYKLVNNAKGVAAKIANDEVEELMAIRKRLTDRGGNIRELIKQIYQKDDKDKWVNKLIYKYNKDFYTFIDKNAESGNRDKAWLKDSIDVEAYKKEALQKMNENISYYERRYADDPDLLEQVVYEETLKWDIDNPDFNGWNNYVIKRYPQEKWQSEEYIKLTKDKDLLALYEFISKINLKAKSVGYIQNAVASTFLPFIRKSMAESLAWDSSLSAITSLGDRLSIGAEDVGYGSINELTKELEHGIPKYYTHDFSKAEDGTHDYSDVSEDLFKNMIMYINHMEKYSMLSEIEGQLQLVKTIEAAKDHLNTSQTGDIIIENGSPKELAGNKENTQMFDDFLRGLLYEQKYPLSDSDTPLNLNVKNAVKKAINKIAGRVIYTPEENPSAISLNKSIDAMNRAFQLKTLGFEVLSGAVNAFGANIQVATQAGNYFKAREVLANENKLLGNRFKNDDERNMFIQLVETFMPLKDDPTYDKLKKAGLTKITQGSFSDFLMMFMRQPEQHMEKSIFLTLLDNTMVEDGKLVNIREFVKNKYKDRYSEGAAKAREIDNKIDSEIAELKKTRSISVTKKLVDGKLEVPGLDLNNIKEVQRLTNLTRRIARNATGGMADSDLNRASMNIWLKSMMVFKGWIPKLLKTRFSELAEVSDDFSTEIDEDGMTIGQKYDIGRIRLFGHVLGDGIMQGAANIHNIIVLNDAGLARLDKMYEDFAASYEKRTGKVFQMDKADFIDLMRNNLRNQIKELAILMSLFGMALSLGFFEPEDDEDKATKNFYRFSQRTIDKFVGELSFFYNPVEFQKLLSGSAFPALGIFSDIERFTSHFFMETTGLDLSDTDLTSEEVRKKAQPIKHFSKMLPITKSMITYLSIFDSDFAKEYDVTIQKESRR